MSFCPPQASRSRDRRTVPRQLLRLLVSYRPRGSTGGRTSDCQFRQLHRNLLGTDHRLHVGVHPGRRAVGQLRAGHRHGDSELGRQSNRFERRGHGRRHAGPIQKSMSKTFWVIVMTYGTSIRQGPLVGHYQSHQFVFARTISGLDLAITF
jgi:hypothetical protein